MRMARYLIEAVHNSSFVICDMDIKLLGSSGIAAALICAMTVQHSYSSRASTLERAQAPAHKQAAPHAKVVNILTAFAPPAITGFLNPEGFNRPAWQELDEDKWVAPPAKPSNRFVVMLDPGHGGTDPGAKAHNGLLEKDLTLDIARRVRLFLSEFDDIEVVLTREHDHGLSRQARVRSIRNSDADIVISLHFNHLPQSEVTLVESYYAGPHNIAESQSRRYGHTANGSENLRKVAGNALPDLSFTQGSARLAETIQQRVFNEVSFENPRASDAGVKQDTLFVLTRSFTPGTLIELTCLSNIDEAQKLNTEQYRNRLAAALADGIRHYRTTPETTTVEMTAQLDY